jgi:hypothetical protein
MINIGIVSRNCRVGLISCIAVVTCGINSDSSWAGEASANDAAPAIDSFHELETKYIFGFTSGADIGVPGEQSVEFETTTASAMRGGHYSNIEQEIEYENVPSAYFGYELSAHGTSHAITGVEGLDNIHRTTFSGLSADLRFAILDRVPGSPVGLTFEVEPEWERVDGADAGYTANYSTGFTLIADTELVPNRLYGAVNVNYTPEVGRPAGSPAWQGASSAGLTGAVAYRIAPKVTIGDELEYYRAYDGAALNSFGGNALYDGPTLHIQFNSKTMLALAFSSEIAGHAVGDPRPLDLTNFPRYRGNMKFEVEF